MTSRTNQIAHNLSFVKERIAAAAVAANRNPAAIHLIVVTKNFPVSDCEILYQLGERAFGENRDQEGLEKSRQLPRDIEWHFQGQIQSNKIRSILSWANTIHSLSEISHAKKINLLKASAGGQEKQKIFVQVNLDDSDDQAANVTPKNRGGISPELLHDFVAEILSFENFDLVGLMAVAPLNQPAENAYGKIFKIHQEILLKYPSINQLSAGMSGDFESAIAYGTTHIRIGSSILGERLTLT